MIIQISSDAIADLEEGFWFYEAQSPGLGDYFRDCLIADIDSLVFYGGIHQEIYGYYRMLSKRFPFAIYYGLENDVVTVIAVLDARRNPLWIRERLN
ncbi:MAG: type II toxin-antitoxin system RelE/ParE family toxin [Cyanothece sp. SIO2G6]|nr:type II toxin-antitoxin system RelE/ParE family toxin [Cyanothece sp. SIO2G6]